MTLLKTSALNGIAVLTRVGTALLLNKILAVHVGPAGYAVIGQFQSLVGMVTGWPAARSAPASPSTPPSTTHNRSASWACGAPA